MTITFYVSGRPRPAGSKRAIPLKSGRIIVTDTSGEKGKTWRGDVRDAAKGVFSGPPLEGALSITVVFFLRRPKGHMKKDGSVKPSAPQYHTGRPDTTKLLRAVEDALTGIVWRDDAQIDVQIVSKVWGVTDGCEVGIVSKEE